MKWSIGAKIMSGYVLALLTILVIAGISYRAMLQFMADVEQRKQTNELLIHLEQALSYLKDAETGQRGYILTGQKDYLTRFETAEKDVAKALEELRKRSAKSPTHEFRLSQLKALTDERFASLQEAVTLFDGPEGGLAKAQDKIKLGAGKKLMDDIYTLAGQIENDANSQLETLVQQAQDSALAHQVHPARRHPLRPGRPGVRGTGDYAEHHAAAAQRHQRSERVRQPNRRRCQPDCRQCNRDGGGGQPDHHDRRRSQADRPDGGPESPHRRRHRPAHGTGFSTRPASRGTDEFRDQPYPHADGFGGRQHRAAERAKPGDRGDHRHRR